jgi:hypothetical protein
MKEGKPYLQWIRFFFKKYLVISIICFIFVISFNTLKRNTMNIRSKLVLIVFGNIDFNDDVATIYRVDNCMMIPQSETDIIVEGLVNYYDGYIIPQLYSGEIIWKNE